MLAGGATTPQATHLKKEKKKTNDELNFVLRPLDIAIELRSAVVYKVT